MEKRSGICRRGTRTRRPAVSMFAALALLGLTACGPPEQSGTNVSADQVLRAMSEKLARAQ